MDHPMPRVLWNPLPDSGKNVKDFIIQVNQSCGTKIANYHELWRWSVDPVTAPRFWLELYRYLRIASDTTPTYALPSVSPPATRAMYPPPRFFPEVKLNFAENMFIHYKASDVILHLVQEGGQNIVDVTWSTLRAQTQRLASAMVESGIGIGDRVASVISNRQETISCCLAALSLGAIWSSTSPDMGFVAVLSRLTQIQPKLVFCESGVLYNNKKRKLLPSHRRWAEKLAETAPELASIVVLPPAYDPGQKVEEHSSRKMISWGSFLSRARERPLSFARLPFSHPAFIVYSSGTSGLPKCIVHSAGGLLMQVKKDALLSYDIRPGDTILQYTTTAWIMWGIVLVSLSYGGKVVVYDGSPLQPDELVLLRLVEQLRVTLLGTSAKFLTHLRLKNRPVRDLVDLSSLRTVTSTGSTLTPEVAEWFYEVGFPPHVHLLSTCGGTDLACSLITGNATQPLYAGEIQSASLGMAVDIFDDENSHGNRSILTSRQPGDLVCTQPFPSQPVCFWADHEGARYQESYFSKFGITIWNQGDFVSTNLVTGGFLTHGRSDGVLNPAGVRFGSAEIYSVVEKDEEVADSLCVGQRRPSDSDETVLLFIQLTSRSRFVPSTLHSRLRQEIARQLTPRHVPRYIFAVPDIPYTVNGKKVETVIKKIISGADFAVSPTIGNPGCLPFFRQFVDVEEVDAQQRRAWGQESKL